MKKRPIIIDCDTGTDDAIAIAAALGCEELDVRAITTVCGNVDLCYTCQNTLNLVHALGFDVPVAVGADSPLMRDITELRRYEQDVCGEQQTHGQTGMGNVVLPQYNGPFYPKNATETIYEQAVQCQGELEILAVGPQTNVALALKAYPDLKKLIKKIYFMGGAVKGGNMSAVAEFNVFFDPEAAKVVLESGIDMVMVGLDVTERAIVPDDVCEEIRTYGSAAATITADLLDYMRRRRDDFGGEDVLMHDATAVAAMCAPETLTLHHYYVDVECAGTYTYGHTYVQKNTMMTDRKPNCYVAEEIDVECFVTWLAAKIKRCGELGKN